MQVVQKALLFCIKQPTALWCIDLCFLSVWLFITGEMVVMIFAQCSCLYCKLYILLKWNFITVYFTLCFSRLSENLATAHTCVHVCLNRSFTEAPFSTYVITIENIVGSGEFACYGKTFLLPRLQRALLCSLAFPPNCY